MILGRRMSLCRAAEEENGRESRGAAGEEPENRKSPKCRPLAHTLPPPERLVRREAFCVSWRNPTKKGQRKRDSFLPRRGARRVSSRFTSVPAAALAVPRSGRPEGSG